MRSKRAVSWIVGSGLAVVLLSGTVHSRSRAKTVHRTISAVTAHEYWLFHKQSNFKAFKIIDLRPAAAYSKGHIPGAKSLPITKQIASKLLRLNRRQATLIYSRAGKKALEILKLMKKYRFREVYNIEDGFIAWTREGYPVKR